jgi:hypothetical protein
MARRRRCLHCVGLHNDDIDDLSLGFAMEAKDVRHFLDTSTWDSCDQTLDIDTNQPKTVCGDVPS